MQAESLTFHPLYMERVWGGRKLQTLFARALPDNVPMGESWELVDREDSQSIVSEGRFRGTALHELWTNHRREIFGDGYDSGRFPILVKILDAADTLSLQVHPGLPGTTSPVAEPKSEFWYFVGTDAGASIYAGLKQGVSQRDFETALATGQVLELLHRIPTQVDGYIYIPGGRLHAIDAGNVMFEIQQNSDTTYRVFDWNRLGLDGKPRQLHIEKSLPCIDFDDFEPVLSKSDAESLVACDWFRIDRWMLHRSREANREPKFSIFQVIAGTVSFGTRLFQPGDLFLVPAISHKGSLKPHAGAATVLRTTL